ncbi:MAG: cytidine/deoxycytidylate deaminase family protein [Candidatus Paceibacterota bacterium]
MKKAEKKVVKHKRPSWDEYFIEMATLVSSRGTCDRAYVGAVIVKDKRLLATGYNGAPVGLPHCSEVGHEIHTIVNEDGTTSEHCIRTTHAETNAIANAARFGVPIAEATMYCTHMPCYACAKILINAGIKRFVAKNDYHASKRSKEIFKKAGIKLEIIN